MKFSVLTKSSNRTSHRPGNETILSVFTNVMNIDGTRLVVDEELPAVSRAPTRIFHHPRSSSDNYYRNKLW